MAVAETDVSWQTLGRIVRDWAGSSADICEVKSLDGGFINTTLLLVTKDGTRAVLKIAPHRVNRDYEREAYQLNLLRSQGLPVPEVYSCNVAHLDNPDSYLLMEFIDGVDMAMARSKCTPAEADHLQMHLAELVLSLHERTDGDYHRVDPAAEARFDSWPEFYRYVYDSILREVVKSGILPVKVRKQIEKIHGRLDTLIASDDRPRLVHWDIWSSNVLCRPDAHGKWWVVGLLDPNCKFAHAEAEIAYLELFNTVTPAFLRTYQQARKLPAEYHRLRKPVYQVYPLLNHVRLFGQKYIGPLTAAVERSVSVV